MLRIMSLDDLRGHTIRWSLSPKPSVNLLLSPVLVLAYWMTLYPGPPGYCPSSPCPIMAWRTLGLSLWPLLHLTLDRKCYLLANIVLSVSWQLGPSPDAIHVSPPSCNYMLPSTTEGHHNLNWVLLFPNQHFPVPSHPACIWHMTAFSCLEADMCVRVCSCAHLHNTHILHLGGSWRPSLSSIIASTNEWNHGLLMCPFLRSQQSTPVAKLRTVALSWWVNIPGNASELYCIPEARATPNYSTLNCVQS